LLILEKKNNSIIIEQSSQCLWHFHRQVNVENNTQGDGLSWDLQGQLTEFNWLQILIYFRNSSVLEMMHLYSFLVHIPRKDLTILSLVCWSLCATVNIHLYDARLLEVTSKKFLYMWCLLRIYNRLFRFLCRIRKVLVICPNMCGLVLLYLWETYQLIGACAGCNRWCESHP